MSKLLQSKVIYSDRGTVYIQEMINDWLIEAKLTEDKIEVENIHVPSGGIFIILYRIKDEEEETRILEKYKKKKEEKERKTNYFRG